MNIYNKKYIIKIIITLLYCCITTGPALGLSLRFTGEYEKRDIGESLLNPNNYLNRTTDLFKNVALIEETRELWSGDLIAGVRFDFTHIENPERDSDLYDQVNELFYQKEFKNMQISLGRKKVRWGVGYGLSPTDIITDLRKAEDPSDRLWSRKGTDLLSLSFFQDKYQFDMIYFPETVIENWKQRIDHNRLGFRYYRYIEPADVSLVGQIEEQSRWTAGLNFSSALGTALELHGEYIFKSFNDLKYPDFKGGPKQLSMSYPFSSKDSEQSELLLGGHYTFKNYWNLTLEYIYLSRGYSNDQWEDYTDNIEFLNENLGPPSTNLAYLGLQRSGSVFAPPLRNHYIFSRLFKQNISDMFSFEGYSFLNLSDFSGFCVLQPKYTESNLYNLFLRFKNYFGHSSSEFGLVPEQFVITIGAELFWI